MSDIIGRDRKKRVQRLKKLIVYGILTAICLPTLLCIGFGIYTFRLKGQVKELQQELTVLKEQQAADTVYETETNAQGLSAEAVADTVILTEEDSIRAWEKLAETAGTESQTGLTPGSIRKVYLTFDDGPSPYTDEILDILKAYDVKATFFVVGEGKKAYEPLYRRIVEEGHTLGMHSFSHVYADIYSSKEAFVKDVNALQDYLHEVTGVYPDVYRFPGGSSNHAGSVDMQELKEYLNEIGVSWHDWNVSSGDATARLGKEQLVRNCVADLESYRTAVILMHDAADKKSTVEALPEIIEAILEMDDTVIVPITADTIPVQHRSMNS